MKAVLIVLDSMGIGGATDADLYGDLGSDTLKAVSRSPYFRVPNLIKVGISNIDNIDYLPTSDNPSGAVARLKEKGKNRGKA